MEQSNEIEYMPPPSSVLSQENRVSQKNGNLREQNADNKISSSPLQHQTLSEIWKNCVGNLCSHLAEIEAQWNERWEDLQKKEDEELKNLACLAQEAEELNEACNHQSDVNWTGTSKKDVAAPQHVSSFSHKYGSSVYENSPQELPKQQHRSSFSSNSLSSILDNISTHSDSAISGISNSKAVVVGKALGEKIEAFKPSVSLKWKTDGNGSCSQCNAKDEEIHQLKMRLERAYSRHNISLPPEDTINKILLGHPYSLESYRMTDDKIKLLDIALETMDSSTILAILIFLKNTMKKSLFIKELQTRPFGAQIYINYLKQKMEHTEVLDIMGILGRTEEAAMYKYELAITSPSSEQSKNLKNAISTHFGDPSLAHEEKLAKHHLDLIDIQGAIDIVDSKDQSNLMLSQYPRATSLFGQSLLTSLFYCCMYHWQVTDNFPRSPLYLKKYFNITDKQFLWTVVRARAKVKHWPMPSDLDNLMATRGLIGTLSALSGISSSGKVKNTLNIERVIQTLHATEAPPHVIDAYSSLLGSNELKLKYGLLYKCHMAVVEAYVGQKDRESLEAYLKQMTFGSPEYIKAEQALRNAKWKS